MKKLFTLLFISHLFLSGFSQVSNRVETNCSSQMMSIYGVLGTGKALIVASEGFDCSICQSEAPALQSWALQNKTQVAVWGAMTNTYSSTVPGCTETNNWVNTYGWSDIFTFIDVNEFYFQNGTPRYTVYSPKDSAIAYQGFSKGDAQQAALTASAVTLGISDKEILKNVNLYTQGRNLHIKNLPLDGAKVQVVNLTGAMIKEKTVLSTEGVINLDAFSNGIYLVRVSSRGQSITKRISLAQ